MALKHEGYTASDWDSWSRNDARYHSGECYTKWDSFQGTSSPVTGGTIFHLAVENGFVPSTMHDDGRGALDWDASIKYDNDYQLLDKSYIDGKEIHEPKHWNPVQEIVKYLDTLFESDDIVAYSTESYAKTNEATGEVEKYLPAKGAYDRTAGELIDKLLRCDGKINEVLGDYNEQAGAWVRFNPMDGKGVKNENVAQFRYALVESDNMDLEKQNAIVRELELPIATLVYSGSKSIHAVVRIEATNKEEYKKRVDYLYKICKKNGLNVDEQNKNPSRLSRLPGFMRGDKKQFIIDTNIGKTSWDEWYQHIEDLNDELPDPESLIDFWEDMPPLAPELIKGVLRQGHKMLIAGPSKAGKSFALINMSIAIAEGHHWFGWECTQGKVLYVNLELDRASCLHRFRDVYKAMGIEARNISNIDIWNLRGKTVPMDKLAPKLIRRAYKKGYIAVIIDPIYKVLTGDENSADQMAHFTNQFDKVATELGSSVIYCHHHSKGSQGGKKSMDRASGSGVFARDPDALIDLVELELTDEIRKQQINSMTAKIYQDAINKMNRPYMEQFVGLDDLQSSFQMRNHFERAVTNVKDRVTVNDAVTAQTTRIENSTAWRVDGTLREFAKFKPRNIWFSYPTHTVDDTGILADIQLDDNTPSWKKNLEKSGKKQNPEQRKKDRKEAFETAYSALNDGIQPVTQDDMCEYLGISSRTFKRRMEEIDGYKLDGNLVIVE
nr:MAG TPA: Regulatory protein repA [Caudoviricetes sp.]